MIRPFLILMAVLIAANCQCPLSKADEPTPFHLALTPAQKPLRYDEYRLVFPRSENRPGGGATLMYRGIMGQSMRDRVGWREDRDYHAEVYDLWTAADDEFRRDDAEQLVRRHRRVLHDVALAVRSTEPGWNFPYEDGIGMPLEESNFSREIARVLALKIRLQLLDADFAGAAESLRIGFGLAKLMMQTEYGVMTHVGLNIADSMLLEVERWMQQPGAPSLYWGLLELRSHMIPDPAIQVQNEVSVLLDLFIPFTTEQLSVPLSLPDQHRLASVMAENLEMFRELGYPEQHQETKSEADSETLFGSLLQQALPSAKRRLVDKFGFNEEQLDGLPTVQVVALAIRVDEQSLMSQAIAAFSLPYPQAMERYVALKAEVDAEARLSAPEYPTTEFARDAMGFLRACGHRDRRLAELITCAAIRLYLGEHADQLPSSLDQLDPRTPAPLDPLTLLPFEYSLEQGVGLLEPPAVSRSDLDRSYRITAAKPE